VDVGSFLALIVAVVSAVVAILAVREARKANGDRWAFEWAAQRPVVYPLLSLDWLRGR